MAEIKWLDDTTITTLLSTGLNSLADGSSVLSAAFDNGTELDMYADLELVYDPAADPGADIRVAEIYLLNSVDDTNYPIGDASNAAQVETLVATLSSGAGGAGATRVVASGIILPPRNMKFLIKNVSGQAWAASGNTLKIKPYKLQSV